MQSKQQTLGVHKITPKFFNFEIYESKFFRENNTVIQLLPFRSPMQFGHDDYHLTTHYNFLVYWMLGSFFILENQPQFKLTVWS